MHDQNCFFQAPECSNSAHKIWICSWKLCFSSAAVAFARAAGSLSRELSRAEDDDALSARAATSPALVGEATEESRVVDEWSRRTLGDGESWILG